ncbi:MAG: diguanylate cyclase [Campylobacterales bacterium]
MEKHLDYPVSILIVEDEADVRQQLATFLRRRGATIYEAANGEEGLELFNKLAPNLIISDIQMPKMTGLEMARIIKSQSIDTPIIIATAFSDQKRLFEAIESGVDGYLAKPVKLEKIWQEVQKALKIFLYHQEIKEKNLLLERQKMELERDREIINRYVLYSKTDLQGIIVEVTDAFCQLTGYSREELIGRSHNILRDPQADPEIYRKLWETITSGQIWTGELHNRRKDGSYYWTKAVIGPLRDLSGEIVGYYGIGEDLSIQKMIEESAVRDPLTGIYNRKRFNQVVEVEMERAQRYNVALSLVMFDIDHFKHINDTFGHQCGDEVLRTLASLVDSHVRKVDLFARWGGEEFMILLPENSIEEAAMLAEKLRSLIASAEFECCGSVTCSFGVTQYRKDDTFDGFFERVDRGLYQAKNEGRNCVRVIK